jgi:hypothetical protein
MWIRTQNKYILFFTKEYKEIYQMPQDEEAEL